MNYLRLIDMNYVMIGGLGYIVYTLAQKSALELPKLKYSLAEVVGYSEPCNEIINPLRFGERPMQTRFADSYTGTYGLKVYEMVEPASGNWVPIYRDNLNW